MSGHSKWSTIKRKKAEVDKKRGKIFTRCIHEITVAAREGGGDPNANARLRLAIDKAKGANMPLDNIERAIKRATGELKGDEAQELTYEGYGPAGMAVLVQVLTDNKNRTVSELRHAFTKCGGNLGENGCVAWMFEKKGVFYIKKAGLSEESIFELAISAGADDVKGDDDEYWEIIGDPNLFMDIKTALDKAVKTEEAELQMVPKNTMPLEKEEAERGMKLLEMLDDLDDVIDVFSNADFQ